MTLQYIALSLIAFLGLYSGLFIGFFAREEMEPGRGYLRKFMHLVFVAILLVFLWLNQSAVFFIGVPLLILLFSFSKQRETLYYYALGLIVVLSYLYNGFVLVVSLAFLYGFPLGSLYYSERMKEPLQKTALSLGVRYSGFLIVQVAFVIAQFFIK